jgi:hypothetical protein
MLVYKRPGRLHHASDKIPMNEHVPRRIEVPSTAAASSFTYNDLPNPTAVVGRSSNIDTVRLK